jgi:hypothetical protein
VATRPIFTPSIEGKLLVRTHHVEFGWFPGLAMSQARKSIASLHAATQKQLGGREMLEISSKSPSDLGVSLSAFNLMIRTVKHRRAFSLECAYQASKVFERGGPFEDLLDVKSIDAKRDPRLNQHGRLIKFHFFGVDWGLQPRTAFYDWLYINALHKHPELAQQVLRYRAFSDIAFNPERSINCQAYAAALYVSLHERGLLTEEVLKDQQSYLSVIDTGSISNAHEDTVVQTGFDDSWLDPRAGEDGTATTGQIKEVLKAAQETGQTTGEEIDATRELGRSKDSRKRQAVKSDYIEALGMAVWSFASLEWQVVRCCEKIRPGSSVAKSVRARMTAGDISKHFSNLVRNMPASTEREALRELAVRFDGLVDKRNLIVHGKPCTGPTDESRLSSSAGVLEIAELEAAADDFASCSSQLNKVFYGFLSSAEQKEQT